MIGFSGDSARFYARYRRGYPPPVIDLLVRAVALTPADTVIDLGCGTGELTIPLAARVGRVIGVDPEPDMLALARGADRASADEPISWMLGSATDLPRIAAQHGPISAVTLANVIHLLDRPRLFSDARVALRPGGRLTIIANGTPLWLQDCGWSRALRRFLESWLAKPTSGGCGTDTASRLGFRRELTDLGWRTDDVETTYSDTLTGGEIIGGVFSALSDRVPVGADRERFTADCLAALRPHAPYVEQVTVRALIATAPTDRRVDPHRGPIQK